MRQLEHPEGPVGGPRVRSAAAHLAGVRRYAAHVAAHTLRLGMVASQHPMVYPAVHVLHDGRGASRMNGAAMSRLRALLPAFRAVRRDGGQIVFLAAIMMVVLLIIAGSAYDYASLVSE